MTAIVQSVEELRDILHDLQRENTSLRMSSSQGELLIAALESLLAVDDGADPFAVVFQSLRQVFDYSYSAAMVEEGNALCCIASEDEAFIGQTQPINPFLTKILNGRVSAKLAMAEISGPGNRKTDLVKPGQPALYLPIKVLDKHGVLVLVRPIGAQSFGREDISLAQRFSLLASHALATRSRQQSENEKQQLQELTEKLEYHAYYDELTGLANRALIHQRVEQALEARNPDHIFALAFIDVDKFKHINDYFGHSLGDRLLEQIASRISDVIRSTDTLGRISGDEFVLLVEPIEDRAALADIIERVMRVLDEVYVIEDHEIHASMSIGISICPDHGEDYETLRRNADNAMYRAKDSNKGVPVYFSSEMAQALTARMELQNRLRRAIRDQSFICALQPKIDLSTATVIGFEALVRWRDEEGTIRPPSDFVAVASELGLLNEITDIVSAKAVEAFAILDPVFGDETSIALNVAGAQANDPEFMRQLVSMLMTSGCASRMVLELTEDAMVSATQFRLLVHPMLNSTGIRVSIDDFGTGYSCLSALAEIQANELKIDRSFITDIHKDPTNQRILFAIENLAQTIGMSTVAEGVETREELEFLLKETSIDQVQGYLFARPMEAEELALIGTGVCSTELRRAILEIREQSVSEDVVKLLKGSHTN